ncbi:unnamed protein product [Heterobilharzia americana]|nr:unnamed protein product [Heterobilharzia americana]
MLLSKKSQLVARIDEMNYHYSTLINSSKESSNPNLFLRPVNKLVNSNGAPKLFEEIIHLFSLNKRAALRLGWMPLLAYWMKGFRAEVNVQIVKLRKELRHPVTVCHFFETTLSIARQCLSFAQELSRWLSHSAPWMNSKAVVCRFTEI